MTHVTELAVAMALVVGIGALATLSAPKTPSRAIFALEGSATPHAEKSSAESDFKRIEALEDRVAAIAVEQRELAGTIRALVHERKPR